MSSKIILTSELTDAIPKNDCDVTNQHEIENPATNISTQINLNGTSVATDAAVESCRDKKNENMLHPNADTNHVETKNKNKKSKTTIDDSESSKELKDVNTEGDHMETNDNEKTNDNYSALASTDDNPKVEYTNKRIAKQFRVSSTNKIHKNTGGKVSKIFFGTVENLIPGTVKMWKILYDDGDVDIISRTNLLDAIKYYDINRKYDTNHAHKKPISPLLQQKREEEDEKGGIDAANRTTTKTRVTNIKTKATPPKKGKKTKAKVARKEAFAEWTGPPNEDIDGGWPKGWVKKVFARKNGASKGSTDRYWYSPEEKFKLRSIVQVKKFLKALVETKGDEKKAKKTMLNY